MIIGSSRVLDQLPAEEPCLGALFTSFSFDPVFFEEHVLRAVLRLSSDPAEQAERYHHEARRALQETPVVTIVDSGERRPGRRLPFDLLEVSRTVFHPKSVLLLYRHFARLMIGSGNLTFAGYGGNTELFLRTDLRYSDTGDASLLAAFYAYIDRVRDMVRHAGTQLDLFQKELLQRISKASVDPVSPRLALLDSTSGPIVQQLEALLPPNSVIQSVGMLAPFYERDDDGTLDVTSVFGVFSHRLGKDACLDVGVAWDNAQVQAQAGSTLADGINRIWSWVTETEGARVHRHFVPTAVRPNSLSYTDAAGIGRRVPLGEVHEAIQNQTLWMQPTPIVFAPQNTISAAKERFRDVKLWLHPANRLNDGRPAHRPLHAKLLVISYRSSRTHGSLVMLGSPNMSRRALLLPAGPGMGNVEAAVAFRLDSLVTLRDLVPELVYVPSSSFELKERKFPDPGRNYALAIDQAVHDPVKGTLVVTWSSAAADLPAWKLSYDNAELAASTLPPRATVIVPRFVLKHSTAETVLHVEGLEFPVPILVTDLVALPASNSALTVGLEELLMLLGRRIGGERAIQIAERRRNEPASSDELATMFGDSFAPTDVFRAWWCIAEDLKDEAVSVPGVRLRLEGALGAGAAWACMLKAQKQEVMTAEEVWFYGAELLRTLSEVDFPPTEDRDGKYTVLKAFCERVRKDLSSLVVTSDSRPWVRRIRDFYSEVHS
jgi:hypothetical protein